MNPLQEFPAVRQWAYRAVWVVGLALGAVQVYMVTIGNDQPEWLTGALAVLAYVSVATNFTADRNVSPTTVAETPPEDRGFVDGGQVNERGALDSGVLVTIAAVVVIVCGVIFIAQAF
jgi:hypothetical protein